MKWQQMTELLNTFANRKMEEYGFLSFFVIILMALLCAFFISFLYVQLYKRRATGSHVYRAFPLLAVSVTAIFICVQFSLPLSLGLLGALSIVRFRTPIKEPEEVGFIMLVIATSLCCATFNMFFLGIIMLAALIALFVQALSRRIMKGGLNDGMLIISIPAKEYQAGSGRLMDFLKEKVPAGRLDSITEGNEESVVSYSFPELGDQTMKDIQGIKSFIPGARTNIFINRSGQI